MHSVQTVFRRREREQARQSLVHWPSPQDYNEAIQNPSSSLTDRQLSCAETELTLFGIPKPTTGAFASVYRLKSADCSWAIRCFLNKRIDQHERYRVISEHLQTFPQSYTVGFEYQEHGLRINNKHYPILKMDWAEGVPLNEYISANLYNSDKLSHLALEWKTVVAWLEENQIAHGDLQHGNILISDGKIKLVDYDGMFVPNLRGLDSVELGHRNYQHPNRRNEHFDLWLDRFPAWVIYTSIFCLSRDSSLWNQLRLSCHDESLLFKQTDFQDSLQSKAFYILENHTDEEIRTASRILRSFLQMPIDEIPSILIPTEQLPHAKLLPVQPPKAKRRERSAKATCILRQKARRNDEAPQTASLSQRLHMLLAVLNPMRYQPSFPVNTGSAFRHSLAVFAWSLKTMALATTLMTLLFSAMIILGMILMHANQLPYLGKRLKSNMESAFIQPAPQTPLEKFTILKTEGDDAWSNGLYWQATESYFSAASIAKKFGFPPRDQADVLYLLADSLKNMGDKRASMVLDEAVQKYLQDGSIDDQAINSFEALSTLYRESDRGLLAQTNNYIDNATKAMKPPNHAALKRLQWIKEENRKYIADPEFTGSVATELTYKQSKLLEHATQLLTLRRYFEASKAYAELLGVTQNYPHPDAFRAELMLHLAQCKMHLPSKPNDDTVRELLFNALSNYKGSGVFDDNAQLACTLLSNALSEARPPNKSLAIETTYLNQYLEAFKILAEDSPKDLQLLNDLVAKTKSREFLSHKSN